MYIHQCSYANYKLYLISFPQVLAVMLHPVNRLSIHCTTPMATLLLSDWSSQDENTLYTDVLVTDQHLVTEMTSTYRTTLRATKTLTLVVAALTTLHQGILHVLSVHFMREAHISLPLTLKYSTRQPLKQTRSAWFSVPDPRTFKGLN